ncbi:protein kinase family protein [Streptacidiphilus sp. PB12-B1b]|uniref:protein kinase family protein n=1 Tax=Streptacidiphilus sp. PB12-B1b TaxID=2705012 RepID=UPI0015FCE3C1|nr:protein kinase family protein [Streptacidiphilus sp. PB12-B1b]QMU79306.1 protein kinase family protein [Streptacidiphilus sp. PB12-B1b]
MAHGARLADYQAASGSLARCSDSELGALVDAAAPMGSGIGGTSALLQVDGVPVFVKRVPLTDLERRPENVGSTANLFGLPAFCHFGVGTIGGPGFGAWRELAVHTMTTDWVLAGEHEGFPLMYHWRVLPHPGQALPRELADVEQALAYWGAGPGMRRRIEALRDSSASIALFLEYIPQNLHDWLGARIEAGDEAADRACAMVAGQLEAGVSFFNARGLLHLDTHFQNILTDGRRLYFADYGLSLASGFDLSDEEAGFFARHRSYDRCYTATHLVIWLVTALYGHRQDERSAFVRACAQGLRPTGIPARAAALIARHAPVAAVMTDFYRAFQRDSRQTPFPLEALRRIDGPDTALTD